MLFFLLTLTSCYTKTKSPDQSFMSAIRHQAAIDSSRMTSIEIVPKKQVFRKIKPGGTIDGAFTIKNTGQHTFYVGSIESNCDCIETKYPVDSIAVGDSMQVFFKMNVKDTSTISSSIIAIGNCQYGNQTFFFEGIHF